MNSYDIYVDRLLKDGFDIYKYPVEAIDVLIQKLSFKSLLSVSGGLSIGTELQDFLSQYKISLDEIVGVNSSQSNLLRLVPVSYESGIALGGNAAFYKRIISNPDQQYIYIGSSKTDIFYLIPVGAKNKFYISCNELDAILSSAIKPDSSSLFISSNVNNILKTCLLHQNEDVGIGFDAHHNVVIIVRSEDEIGVNSNKVSFGYATFLHSNGGFCLDTSLADLIKMDGLGKWGDGIASDVMLLTAPSITYFVHDNEHIGVSSSSLSCVLKTVADTHNCGVSVGFDLSAICKRSCKLDDYNGSTLIDMDNADLETLSFNEVVM